jgi:putative alpha-1,2-mannosidase
LYLVASSKYPYYLIGSPTYGKITFNLPSGKTFISEAVNNSEQNIYIQSVKLNGVPLTIPVIRYTDIVNGGKLEFIMGPAPSRWAADWNPPALADSLPK